MNSELESMIRDIDDALVARHYRLLEKFLIDNNADPAHHELLYYKDAFTYVLAERQRAGRCANVRMSLAQAKSLWPSISMF